MDRCEKHDETMDRLFTTINRIEQRMEMQYAEQSAKLDVIIQFKDEIHKIVYGNGQEGLTSKVRRALSQLGLQWALLVVLITAVVGYAISQLFG